MGHLRTNDPDTLWTYTRCAVAQIPRSDRPARRCAGAANRRAVPNSPGEHPELYCFTLPASWWPVGRAKQESVTGRKRSGAERNAAQHNAAQCSAAQPMIAMTFSASRKRIREFAASRRSNTVLRPCRYLERLFDQKYNWTLYANVLSLTSHKPQRDLFIQITYYLLFHLSIFEECLNVPKNLLCKH